MSAWLPVVLGLYWAIVLGILGRMLVVCNRTKSDSVETEKTDTNEG